jgi:hypothetical protein
MYRFGELMLHRMHPDMRAFYRRHWREFERRRWPSLAPGIVKSLLSGCSAVALRSRFTASSNGYIATTLNLDMFTWLLSIKRDIGGAFMDIGFRMQSTSDFGKPW